LPALRRGSPDSEAAGEAFQTAAFVVVAAGCAFVPWVFTTRIDDVFYLPKLVILWVLLGLVLWLLAVGTIKGERTTRLRLIGVVDLPLLAFVALNLLALALSEDRHQSLFGEQLQHQGVLTMLLYVAFFYVGRVLISSNRRLRILFGAVAVGATGVSAYAIVQKLGLDPIWKGYLPSGRVFSTIGQPNALAAYLVIAIPVTATLTFGQKKSARIAALAGLLSMVVALLVTYSRGGYLGLAVAGGVFIYGYWGRTALGQPLRRTYAGAVILALLATVALVAPIRGVLTSTWNRAWSVSAVNNDESIGAHLDLWRVAARIIETHPFVGTGPETFPDLFPRYSPTVLPASAVRNLDQYRVESPHDEMLAIASGAGIPTALSYLILLAGAGAVLWRAARKHADSAARVAMVAVVAVEAGHFVTDSFMSAEITGTWLFWTLVGAALGVVSATTEPSVAGVCSGSDAQDLRSRQPSVTAPSAPAIRPSPSAASGRRASL
jgi:putative inorganic carbon (HCO3(-)) transporter